VPFLWSWRRPHCRGGRDWRQIFHSQIFLIGNGTKTASTRQTLVALLELRADSKNSGKTEEADRYQILVGGEERGPEEQRGGGGS
jgi:hypothetical protein